MSAPAPSTRAPSRKASGTSPRALRPAPSAPRASSGAPRSSTWGGRRRGAGRKRVEGSGVRHAKRRPTHRERAVFVTLRVRADIVNLRRPSSYRVITRAFEAWRKHKGFRLLHFSVMGNHLHLLVEANNTPSLSRAMQGIAIRIAKGMNRVMGRKRGRVFAGRYHHDVIDTRRGVRNVLAYILCNARKHFPNKKLGRTWVDPWSSGHDFDGWLGDWTCDRQGKAPITAPVSIIAKQWRDSGGGIPPDTVPGQRPHLHA